MAKDRIELPLNLLHAVNSIGANWKSSYTNYFFKNIIIESTIVIIPSLKEVFFRKFFNRM